MIVEMREYTLHAGKVPEYLQLYEREGLEIQRGILGHLVGYYTTEVGEAVNQVVHLWAYESFEDRQGQAFGLSDAARQADTRKADETERGLK